MSSWLVLAKLMYYFFCQAYSYNYSIAIITLCIQSSQLIGLLFSGKLLTLCKCGIYTMVPVECTKWMASRDSTLDHSCVHLASHLTVDCFGVHVFTVELLWTLFDKLLPLSTPPPTLTSHSPAPLAMLEQGACQLQFLIITFILPKYVCVYTSEAINN